MAKGMKFSEGAARRIVAATRAYERGNRDQPPIKFRTVSDDGTPLRLGRTVEQWLKGETQEIPLIFEESCEDEQSGSGSGGGTTLEAHNEAFDVNGDRIVVLGQAANGCWYLLQAESCGGDDGSGSGDCRCPAIGGEDLTTIPGWDAEATQVLGHESGCLKWINTTECEEGS